MSLKVSAQDLNLNQFTIPNTLQLEPIHSPILERMPYKSMGLNYYPVLDPNEAIISRFNKILNTHLAQDYDPKNRYLEVLKSEIGIFAPAIGLMEMLMMSELRALREYTYGSSYPIIAIPRPVFRVE
jgi:hypothetical protein